MPFDSLDTLLPLVVKGQYHFSYFDQPFAPFAQPLTVRRFFETIKMHPEALKVFTNNEKLRNDVQLSGGELLLYFLEITDFSLDVMP